MDQTCIVIQKHHRGKKKPGTQYWFNTAIESDEGGQCVATRVVKRDKVTLDQWVKDHIQPGTTLITDEWAATNQIVKRMPEMRLSHYIIRHKKATGGGFAKWVKTKPAALKEGETYCRGTRPCYVPRLCKDPTQCGWFRVHTNKAEGLNSHLKHKLKRIRGTRAHYIDGYISEAVWRQNARAKKDCLFEAFVDLLRA
jgi:IS1 family transposase